MNKTKILYVEDEPSLARIVRETLEGSGFEVTFAEDGKEALELYKQSDPDICILDIMLPNKDGYSLARDIRNFKPQIPIIFLTAKTQTSDVLKGFESGGNDYIRKPFSMEELIVRVNNLLNLTSNGRKSKKGELIIGSYHFFPHRFELWHNNESRKLSARESGLLEMLWHSRNTTILRKDILMKLWGDDTLFNSRNLDVYITRLRKYLSKDLTVKITTIKGTGYLFMCETA